MLSLEKLMPKPEQTDSTGEKDVIRLSDDDINKIAQRAVELMRADSNNSKPNADDTDADDTDADDTDADDTDADDADADAE